MTDVRTIQAGDVRLLDAHPPVEVRVLSLLQGGLARPYGRPYGRIDLGGKRLTVPTAALLMERSEA